MLVSQKSERRQVKLERDSRTIVLFGAVNVHSRCPDVLYLSESIDVMVKEVRILVMRPTLQDRL
jgi:hypothetical protein